MRPRADEIVHSIAWTFDRYIQPELQDPFARSLALSIGYLLRSVEQRIRHEGAALWALNRELRGVLQAVAALIHETPGSGADGALRELGDEIRQALGRAYRQPDDYPSLESLTEEATALRWPLVHAIEALRARQSAFEANACQRVREAIRQYLKHQLEREAEYVQIRAVAGLDPLAGRV